MIGPVNFVDHVDVIIKNEDVKLDNLPESGLGSDKEDNAVERIRRKTPRCPGVYIEGSVEGTPLWVTADTGASRTVLAKTVFDRIPETRRSSLTDGRVPLDQAGGSPLKEYGRATVNLKLGLHEFSLEVCVADIKDEMLLGMDVGDTYDVVTSKGVVVVDGLEIPCVHIKSDRLRKVFAPRKLVVPGNSEAIFDATVESFESEDDADIGDMVIEPTPYFSERHALIMAACLVDVKGDMTAKVRIMNPFDQPVTVRRSTVIGFAQHYEGSTDVLDTEDPTEDGNQEACRRLKFTEQTEEVIAAETVHPQHGVKQVEVPSHLQDLYQRTTENIKDSAEQRQLAEVLIQYQDVFSKDDTDLGLTHLTEHAIETGDARPVKQPPRKVPMAMAGEEKKAIDQMLKQGIIRESCSPWASPVVLVRKKNGKTRACIDYRRLNTVTIKDAYPIPTTQECLDAMAGSLYFTTLDMTSGYHQIPVREKDIPKTAFVTKQGLYEFKAMSFGLTNAPATFQRVMELALRGLQWSTCLIYLDDVLIFGTSFKQHLGRLQQVLERISAAKLKLKPDKCSLLQAEVTFLGHIVSQDGVRPNPDNIAKIKQWTEPTNVTEVRQFLGLCSYYRRFIKDFSVIAKPLTELTCNDSPLIWADECQVAFDQLKSKLISPDIMAYPRPDSMFILDTDACDEGIGAVLSQVQDGHEKVIAYASRLLNKAKRNYCVTDKELLALKYFTEYFRQYLLGREFLIRTDHQALKWLFSLKEPKGRIARWIEILSAFNFTVEYRPGKKHGNADGLSRCPNPRDCQCPDNACLEDLRCGPCNKCKRRYEEMQCSWQETHQVLRTTTQRSVSAEGDPATSQNFPFWDVLFIVIFPLVMFAQYPLSLLGKIANKVGVLQGVVLDPVEDDSEPSQVYPMDQDDGRLIPKLSILQRMVQFMLRLRYTLSPGRVGKVDTRSSSVPLEPEAWFQTRSHHDLLTAQSKDPCTRQVADWLEKSERPPAKEMYAENPELRHYWNIWSCLELQNGLVFKRFVNKESTKTHYQLLLPKTLRQEVLQATHNSVWSGHLGRKKTAARVSQKYYWYEFREDVNIWVSRCDICAAMKAPTKKPKAPRGDMRVGAPLDRICIDVLGPLPMTDRGNSYILVVCDAFTKWVEAFPIPDQTAKTCATVLLDEVICRLGCPLDLHSDQGRNFDGNLFKELCNLLHIRKTRTSPHHPQCNGQCERFNRTLLGMVRAYLQGQQESWDLHLSHLTAAYRATPHESTGLTPNMMMLGREVRLPGEVYVQGPEEPASSGHYCSTLRESLLKAHEVARNHLKRAAQKQSASPDVKKELKHYQPGNLVWYFTENKKEGVSPKLQPLFDGPFLVIRKMGDLNYEIQLDKRGRRKIVHHDKLKPYVGRNTLKWAKRALCTNEAYPHTLLKTR